MKSAADAKMATAIHARCLFCPDRTITGAINGYRILNKVKPTFKANEGHRLQEMTSSKWRFILRTQY